MARLEPWEGPREGGGGGCRWPRVADVVGGGQQRGQDMAGGWGREGEERETKT
jgi:hypothetical protein